MGIVELLPARDDLFLHVARDYGIMAELKIWHAAAFRCTAKLCGEAEDLGEGDFGGDEFHLASLAQAAYTYTEYRYLANDTLHLSLETPRAMYSFMSDWYGTSSMFAHSLRRMRR